VLFFTGISSAIYDNTAVKLLFSIVNNDMPYYDSNYTQIDFYHGQSIGVTVTAVNLFTRVLESHYNVQRDIAPKFILRRRRTIILVGE